MVGGDGDHDSSVSRQQSGNGNGDENGSGKGKGTAQQGGNKSQSPLAEVFCANVFGHYLLVHQLMPLLHPASAPLSSTEPTTDPARVIWVSTLEAIADKFSLSDLQGLRSSFAYESSKRLTDILCLTARDPRIHEVTAAYYHYNRHGNNKQAQSTETATATATATAPSHTAQKDAQTTDTTCTALTTLPAMYLTHPGIVATNILPINAIMQWLQYLTFVLVYWLGSPWHNRTAEQAAAAMVWVALEDGAVLERCDASARKWGSGVDAGRDAVLETVVEKGSGEGDWVGLGRGCWERMEVLRGEWERVLGVTRGL